MTKIVLTDIQQNILNDALQSLKSLLGADSASLFLVDVERHELVLNSIYDEHRTQFKGLRQPIGEGVAGSVANQGKAVLVTDIKKDPRFPKERFRHYHTNSFICVPIANKYGLVGVINITDKKSGAPFSQKDFDLACLVSCLASELVEKQMDLTVLKQEKDALSKEQSAIREEKEFMEKFASMGKLAGGIVHEINNPLDAVMRYTNMLIERDLDESLAKEYLNEIKVGLSRITKITRSLLEFAQQLNENQRREYVDVNDMVEEALSLFRHALIQGPVRVEKELDLFLPKVLDKGLCRVFSNMVKNAFDAMPQGGLLRIKTQRSGDDLLITFSDTGIGMPPEVKDKIFTPFFTTKPIGQGVGLGLPICFEVIQKYHGRVEIDSQVGQGAEFRIYLPLLQIMQSS